MKRTALLLVMFLMVLAACGDGDVTETASPTPAESAAVEAVVDPTATAVPEPTAAPTVTAEPALITTADELAGIWEGTIAGERGYVLYTADGHYRVALAQDDLATAPRVSGDYWFEDGQIHLRDLENAGHWAECAADLVGVYEVIADAEGALHFQTVADACDEGGFTRNYLFANMTQVWIGAPIDVAPAAAPDEEGSMPELAAALQAIVDSWVSDAGAPGVLLMVDAPDLGFTWKGAAGMADPEAGVPLVPDDQFIISSMTKMMTAVTVMKLAEQGLLDLDDPIGLYLPAELVARLLVLDGDSYGEAITVRQLLSHTSGLGDFSNGADNDGSGLPDFKDLVLAEPEKIWDETQVLEWAIANAPPVAQPGEMYNYSDTNYQLLGLIIESVAELDLPEAYRQFIFEPLGMDHTYFEFRETALAGVDGRPVSHAYYGGTLWNALDSHSYEWGSGGLVSTVEDMNRFLWAWVSGELLDDPAGNEAMMAWGEAPGCGAYYGLGLWRFVYDECDIPGLGENIGHGGLFNSHAHYWPEQNVTIIGTLNSNEPDLGFIGVMLEVMFAIQEATSS